MEGSRGTFTAAHRRCPMQLPLLRHLRAGEGAPWLLPAPVKLQEERRKTAEAIVAGGGLGRPERTPLLAGMVAPVGGEAEAERTAHHCRIQAPTKMKTERSTEGEVCDVCVCIV